MNKLLIDYLLSNSGKPLENETWYSLGIRFNVKAPNKKRAKKDEKYRKKAIGRRTQEHWQRYLQQKNRLKLDKEVYKDGELKWETFKDKPEKVNIDSTDYNIEKITTNPYGGAWYTLKKKEGLYTEEHFQKLKELLTKELKPQQYKPTIKTNEKALFIYTSDKHIGALTKEDSIYVNKYDKQEMRNRIVIATLNIIDKAVKIYGRFSSIFIMDLGDALDGFDGKTTRGQKGSSSHTLPQQLNNREQHDYYVELHKELFDSIVVQEYAKELYYIATSNSNHGGDFEYGAMRNLETYLNVKYPNIHTFVSYKPYNHLIYGKHCIIFGHGKDEEDMRSGLPLTIVPKVENFIDDYIRINKLGDYFITFVSGDLHQSAETYAKNFRYKKVLSQFGSSRWSHTNFGSGSPGVTVEVIEKDSNTIYKEDIFFKIGNQSNTGIHFN